MKIMIIGQMGSGKDLVAKELYDKHNFRPYKLGKYIRSHVDEMFRSSPQDERRDLYQKYGEGMREIFGEHVWNEILDKSISYASDRHNIMITDVRQPHELKYWTEKGYIPVCVDVNDENRLIRLKARDGNNFTEQALTHPTELRAKDIVNQVKSGVLNGYVIDNNGIAEHTFEQIAQIVNQLKEK